MECGLYFSIDPGKYFYFKKVFVGMTIICSPPVAVTCIRPESM
ncbi:hypothetical protein J502_3263 [Acinetobacter sp. 1294596]|nr:hypothetical protein J559_2166 [Acinetobacter sp. 983759]EXF55646.1 hypothetical protein J502_3263 [Acinetobacter sp. 1294596]